VQRTTESVVADLRQLIQVGPQILIWGDGQLITYDDQLEELQRFGNHVTALVDVAYGNAFAVEDDDGIHSLIFD